MWYHHRGQERGLRSFTFWDLKVKPKTIRAELKEGDVGRVTLVIVNREHETVSYGVEVTIDGIRNSVIQPVVLEQGETWEREVSFTPRHSDRKTEGGIYTVPESRE